MSRKNLVDINFDKCSKTSPFFFFEPKDEKGLSKYHDGFSIDKFFKLSTAGFISANDKLNISISKDEALAKIDDLLNMEEDNWRNKYNRKNDSRDWKYENAKEDAGQNYELDKIEKVDYRPFDYRYTYYTGNSRGLFASPQVKLMKQFLNKDNFGLATIRINKEKEFTSVFINKNLPDARLSDRFLTSIFPLYLYPEESTQQTLDGQPERTPNLDKKIVQEIAEKLGLKFVPEKEDGGKDIKISPRGEYSANAEGGVFSPIDLLDYIYAVLHSPSYREKYKEFLKIDFPRVPYPEDPEQFWQLVELGGELRQIHLLEHPVVEDFITTYPESGSNIISNRLTKNDPGFVVDEEEGGTEELKASKGKILRRYQDDSEDDLELGKVWINEEQYFGNVPKKAWEFYIGGYQPAEKWLKDRRDRELTIEEIQHYQKIIVALMETDRLMQEINGVLEV